MQIFRRGEWGLLLATLVVVVLVILLDSQRNYLHNPGMSIVDILRQTSMLGIFALGAAIVIIAGGIDLSSGSMIAFSGTVCAVILAILAPDEMRGSRPLPMHVMIAAVAGTLAVGLLVGSLHAWLITVIGLPPFVATLATLVGLRSLGQAVVEHVTGEVFGGRSTQIQIFDARFRYLGTNMWIPVALFLALTAVCWVLMSRTVVGRHLYALGGNEAATRLSGIRTDRLKWLAYCIGALFSSIAGILYICDQSVADPQTLGRGYELNAIAAAVVGGCSLQGGAGTIPGAALGCLFLRVVVDGVAKIIKSGAHIYEGLIVGNVVVIAVALNQPTIRCRLLPGPLGTVMVAVLALYAAVLGLLFAGSQAAVPLGSATLVLLGIVKYRESRREAAPPP